jgi:translation initiation factor 3 subunit F
MEYHKTMFELHQRVNPREVIVGWFASFLSFLNKRYASGSDITEHSPLIHEFYARETEGRDPVHLLVDTSVRGSKLSISAVIR